MPNGRCYDSAHHTSQIRSIEIEAGAKLGDKIICTVGLGDEAGDAHLLPEEGLSARNYCTYPFRLRQMENWLYTLAAFVVNGPSVTAFPWRCSDYRSYMKPVRDELRNLERTDCKTMIQFCT